MDCSWSTNMPDPEPHLAALPGDGDTLGVTVLAGHGLLQLVQLARLLQLLYQAFHHLLAPLLLLLAILLPAAARLLPAQQPLYHWRREWQDRRHGSWSRTQRTEKAADQALLRWGLRRVTGWTDLHKVTQQQYYTRLGAFAERGQQSHSMEVLLELRLFNSRSRQQPLNCPAAVAATHWSFFPVTTSAVFVTSYWFPLQVVSWLNSCRCQSEHLTQIHRQAHDNMLRLYFVFNLIKLLVRSAH